MDRKCFLIIGILFFYRIISYGQIINYVNNGSFEDCVNCDSVPYILQPKSWGAIDSGYAFMYCSVAPPISNLPYFASGYQYPRSGKNVIGSTMYCDVSTCTYTNSRSYPRNRLKQKLKASEVYCVKYYIVNLNYNSVAIDAFGAYFGDENLDTIKYCRSPLIYLNPQIQNTPGNIIKDTMNWTAITGTFTANGTEKYMVLGNFKSNANTNTILINTGQLPALATDIFFDDVSVIELNLPAYAGRDTSIFAGDSVFIGTQPDVGIDEACQWFKLPAIITPTIPAMDTIAGFWVKPTVNTSYVLRQEICGLIKWDTITVSIKVNTVGIDKIKLLSEEIKLYPVPAKDYLELKVTNEKTFEDFKRYILLNNLGEVVREDELYFKEGKVILKTNDLSNGVYSLQLKSGDLGTVSKRFVVAR